MDERRERKATLHPIIYSGILDKPALSNGISVEEVIFTLKDSAMRFHSSDYMPPGAAE
ncbi:hypothetical protein [Anaerocolumna jejuensis]|uniref:hypothetical protein n=1 Tax=Anaerocolumna jejuensis TaxID=259063 RepID=UPI003F7C6D5A